MGRQNLLIEYNRHRPDKSEEGAKTLVAALGHVERILLEKPDYRQRKCMQRLTENCIGTTSFASVSSIPNLVLLHGWGANMFDLSGLKDVLDLSLDWKLINAPVSLGGSGFCWFPKNLGTMGTADPLAYFNHLGKDVWDELDLAGFYLAGELSKVLPQDTPIFLGGFSQGAITALSQLFFSHLKNPVLGQVLFSPTVWTGFEAALDRIDRISPTFLSHGNQDPILHVSGSRAIRQAFENRSAEIEYHEFRGYHEIPDHIVFKAKEFLRSLLI